MHGKEAPGGGLPLCFGCGRPGSCDGCSSKWKHVGSSEYWEELNECICCRPDCVAGMYQLFKMRRVRQEEGSTRRMGAWAALANGSLPLDG